MPSRKILAILFASTLIATGAEAASPDAWAAFRRDVEASCRAAGSGLIESPTVTVDPFGSESYGLAVLTGKAVDDGSDHSLVCIFDKATRKAEIGGALALQRAAAAAPGDAAAPAASGATPAPATATVDPAASAAATEAPAAASTAADTPAAMPSLAQPATGTATSAEVEAALADRFASFPDDPEAEADVPSPGASNAPAPVAQPEPAIAPQNQPVVTPPVPILPTVPAPTGVPTGEVPATDEAIEGGEGEGAPGAADDATEQSPGLAGAAAAAETAENAALAPSQPSFAGCDAACTATLAAVSETDRKALTDLPFEIERTIGRHAAANLAAGPAAARAAAGAIAADLTGRPSPAIAAPTTALSGERSCVLYYFGYSNEAARSVGRHRCSVSEGEGGALIVEKISGERLRAELKPLTAGVAAFVGRTFKSGDAETRYDPATPVSAADTDLGNSVGLATASDGRLMLTSSELRRFEGEDNFFWVLAIDAK